MQELIKKYAELFMGHVQITKDCWIWTGAKAVRNTKHTPMVYGMYCVAKPKFRRYAHRFCYEFFRGPIPKGAHLDHLCRNPLCVNPAHLEPVTPRENLRRGNTIPARNAAKTHCPQGHRYSEENTILRTRRGTTSRNCRACYQAKAAAYYRKNKHKWVERKLRKQSPAPETS